jgi:natural product precursor
MKTKIKKLTLNKETLKNLTTRQLDKVAGGSATRITVPCPYTQLCYGG